MTNNVIHQHTEFQGAYTARKGYKKCGGCLKMYQYNVKQEEWREYLASNGLPHNEVEGNMIIDLINQQVIKALEQARRGAIPCESFQRIDGFGTVHSQQAIPVRVIDNLIKEYKGDKG